MPRIGKFTEAGSILIVGGVGQWRTGSGYNWYRVFSWRVVKSSKVGEW